MVLLFVIYCFTYFVGKVGRPHSPVVVRLTLTAGHNLEQRFFAIYALCPTPSAQAVILTQHEIFCGRKLL